MRVLVCFVGQLRATRVTYESLMKHLIGPLNADVMLHISWCKSKQELRKTDPLAKIAKYISKIDDTGRDFNKELDRICAERGIQSNWRKAEAIKDNWLGGLNGRKGGNLYAVHKRYLLKEEIHKVIHDYDWFVITRTDFMWLSDHPNVFSNGCDKVYIPTGQDWGGINDRHIVCHRNYILQYLSLLDTLLFKTDELLDICQKNGINMLNSERFLAIHLMMHNIAIARFPSVSFLTGDDEGNDAWAKDEYDPVTRFRYKQKDELDLAISNSRYFAQS